MYKFLTSSLMVNPFPSSFLPSSFLVISAFLAASCRSISSFLTAIFPRPSFLSFRSLEVSVPALLVTVPTLPVTVPALLGCSAGP